MTALDEIRQAVREWDADGRSEHEEMPWPLSTMRRLLTELDADQPQWIDEVAARLFTRWVDDSTHVQNYRLCAELSYAAADALIAEGKRRRGEGE